MSLETPSLTLRALRYSNYLYLRSHVSQIRHAIFEQTLIGVERRRPRVPLFLPYLISGRLKSASWTAVNSSNFGGRGPIKRRAAVRLIDQGWSENVELTMRAYMGLVQKSHLPSRLSRDVLAKRANFAYDINLSRHNLPKRDSDSRELSQNPAKFRPFPLKNRPGDIFRSEPTPCARPRFEPNLSFRLPELNQK